MRINSKNIFLLVILGIIIAISVFRYMRVFSSNNWIPAWNTNKTNTNKLDAGTSQFDEAELTNISNFYTAYPKSNYKVRFQNSRLIHTKNKFGSWVCQLGDVKKDTVDISILNPDDECDWWDKPQYSYDKRYFVSPSVEENADRSANLIGFKLYDFESKEYYTIDKDSVRKNIDEAKKLLGVDSPAIEINFQFSPDPTNKALALYFNAPYRGVFGLLIYKIDDKNKSVNLIYDYKLPTNGDEIEISGWDANNFNQFYIGEISDYKTYEGTEARSVEKGVYKYVDITDNPISLKLSPRNDFFPPTSQFNYIAPEFLDDYLVEPSQEYKDFVTAVKDDNISTEGIYPVKYHFRDLNLEP